VLEAVRVPTEERMVAAIAAILDETEQQFFRNAEHSRSNVDQQRWFDALREVRRGRADIAPRFLVSFEAQLMRPPAAELPAPPAPVYAADLGLVNQDELETRLILEDGAARAEIRMHEALYALSHRFAVLWTCPPLAVGRVPVGPRAINEAFVAAIGDLRLAPDATQILLRVYDRIALQGIADWLDSVNVLFVQHGVLPNFVGYGARRAEASAPAASVPDAAPSTPAKAEVETDKAPGVVPNQTPPADRGTTRPEPDPQPAWTAEDQARFDALRAALGSMRTPGSEGASQGRGLQAVEIGPQDLQTVLAHLQTMPNHAQLVAGRRLPRSVGHVRQAMLEHVARTLPAGAQPVLRRDDEDVLDLMEAFLGTLQSELPQDPVIEQVLTRLQVPLVRLALDDHSFFTRTGHPARQLLGAIADVSQSCFDDDPDGRRMLERLGTIGDRISAEFEQGVDLFQQLFGDLTAHVRSVQRRADAAERRHVEAARGRERLALARRTAEDALADRIAARAPDELLRSTLELAWADVLALTLLRHGSESEIYRQRLLVVERLLAMREAGAANPGEAKAIRDEIENGLSLVGYHLSEARQVMQRLLGETDAESDPAASATLAKSLRARVRLGESRVGDMAARGPLTPAQQASIDRVRALPIGSWLAPGTGDGPKLKLAWRSDSLERVLLINRRATSAEERSIEELAHELERGGLRCVMAPPVPPIERVFQRILAKSRLSADDTFHA
jgi:hypothetical protein